MEVEDFAHDLPFAINFEEIEEIGEAVAGPVVDFQTGGGNCTSNIDAGNTDLGVGGSAIEIVPVVETLNWAGKKLGTDVSENGGLAVKGALHFGATPAAGAVDVVLDCLENGVVLIDGGGGAHTDGF